ncbi:MAG TPA: hypothetical protein VF508_08280, partial [Pyrinomonadaceae bacterium]
MVEVYRMREEKAGAVRRSHLTVTILAAVLLFGSALPAAGQELDQQAQRLAQLQKLLPLEELISEARKYENAGLRVRVETLSADILWPFDAGRARSLASEAFDEV